jgi:hypothetical protein
MGSKPNVTNKPKLTYLEEVQDLKSLMDSRRKITPLRRH